MDIVRRAFETVRFMNVAVMNGNPFKGRDALELDTMPAEEAFGTERPLRPVFAPGGADTRTIAALHQRAYTALTQRERRLVRKTPAAARGDRRSDR